MPNPNTTNSQADETWVPYGFVRVIGPNNQMYVIPEHCLLDLDQIHLSNKKKDELGVSNAQGTVSLKIFSGSVPVRQRPERVCPELYNKGLNGYVWSCTTKARTGMSGVRYRPGVLPAINCKGPVCEQYLDTGPIRYPCTRTCMCNCTGSSTGSLPAGQIEAVPVSRYQLYRYVFTTSRL